VHERRPKLVKIIIIIIIITLYYIVILYYNCHPFFSFLQSTLNSAASLKKWIPSIKNEIEYYLQVRLSPLDFTEIVSVESYYSKMSVFGLFPLQQSQLSHYPERKIAEFQLHMEALEREYKRFIAKLRAVDPGCKHKPWTPRAYCRRRADTRESPANGECVYAF